MSHVRVPQRHRAVYRSLSLRPGRTILLAGLQQHAQGADGELDPAESPTRLIRREMDDLEPCALPFEGDAEMDRAVLPFPLNFKIPGEPRRTAVCSYSRLMIRSQSANRLALKRVRR